MPTQISKVIPIIEVGEGGGGLRTHGEHQSGADPGIFKRVGGWGGGALLSKFSPPPPGSLVLHYKNLHLGQNRGGGI